MAEEKTAYTLSEAQANVTKDDAELIAKIVQRAADMLRSHGRPVDADSELVAAMKITQTHGGLCPLNLWQWLASAQGDFAHDFFGICSWLMIADGTFRNPTFWPIHAKKPARVH